MARPRKPVEEKYVIKSIRFPPALWVELESMIPEGERSAFIHEQVARGLKRRKKRTASAETPSQPEENGRDSPLRQGPTIWDKIEALIDELSEEAFAHLPVDGSEQHDHYIYGLPKRRK